MLISLLIFALVAGLIYWLLTMLPIPDPFKKVVMVIFIVLCIVYLLGFMGLPVFDWPRHRLP
jgi:hypothetical protein